MNQAVRCFFCTKLPASVRNSSSFCAVLQIFWIEDHDFRRPMCGKASINDGVLQKSRCLVWFYIWSCRKKMMIELTHTQTIAAIYVSFAATIISFEIQRVGTKIPKVGTKIRTSRNWNFYRSEFYAQPIAASTIKHPIAPPCLCWRVEAYWIRP